MTSNDFGKLCDFLPSSLSMSTQCCWMLSVVSLHWPGCEMWSVRADLMLILGAMITLAGTGAFEYDNRNSIKSGINTPTDQRSRDDFREIKARWSSYEDSRVTRQNSHPIVYLLSSVLRLLSLLVRY